MRKFFAGVAVGWLLLRLVQIGAENRAFAREWDAFAAGMEARRELFR